MKEIKYLWNFERPQPPTKIQITFFNFLVPFVLFFVAGTLTATLTFVVLSILNLRFKSVLLWFLFSLTSLLFLLIHLFNLVLLTLVFYTLLTPMGFILRRMKVGGITPTKNEETKSYFSKSEPLREDYFLKPF